MEELENHNSIQRRKGIDKHPKIKRNKFTYYMANFSSKEIESQYNLFKKLLSDRINYKEVLEAIKKDISYIPFELKKNLKRKIFLYRVKRVKMISI